MNAYVTLELTRAWSRASISDASLGNLIFDTLRAYLGRRYFVRSTEQHPGNGRPSKEVAYVLAGPFDGQLWPVCLVASPGPL